MWQNEVTSTPSLPRPSYDGVLSFSYATTATKQNESVGYGHTLMKYGLINSFPNVRWANNPFGPHDGIGHANPFANNV